MDSSRITDAGPESVERSRQMEAIMAQYETALLRYATRVVGDAHLARDVVQNAFVKLYANWKEGTRPTDRLKAWLYRVTHNEAVDMVRRESRLQVLHKAHAAERTAACPDGLHCSHGTSEQFEMVIKNLRRLEPMERQVLLLRLEEGLSYAEIAAVTGRTAGNIGCILHNAVTKLARVLTPLNTEERARVARPSSTSDSPMVEGGAMRRRGIELAAEKTGSRSSPFQHSDAPALEGGAMRRRAPESAAG